MPLEFPWVQPTGEGSHYLDAGPLERTRFKLCDIEFVVTPTKERGCDTGRVRYHVVCATCAVERHLWEAVLHPATTGPRHYIKSHLYETHGIPREIVYAHD